MAWYHWMATYLLIFSAFAFWAVMGVGLWFQLGCVATGLIALAMMRYLPPKEDKNQPIVLPKWLESTKNVTFVILGVLSIALFVFSLGVYIYSFWD